MNEHDQALQVLLIVRRRLLDRMASLIVRNRESLLNGDSHSNNPLGHHDDLAEIIKNLSELDGAIGGLADLSRAAKPVLPPPPKNELKQPGLRSAAQPADSFSKFIQLVTQDQLAQASQELAHILHMSLDRMMTATRFFSRTMKHDHRLVGELHRLCQHGQDWSEADCVRALIKTFGFQAVESRMAMQALRNPNIGMAEKPRIPPANRSMPNA